MLCFIILFIFGSHLRTLEAADVLFEHVSTDESYLEGKKQYEDVSRKISTYGNCWKNAVLDLHVGCRNLTEEVQSRLALSFANCFLQNAGSKICRCPPTTSIAECLKNANERVFSTYREFFTHTQNICYFLRHQIWQEQTENTISKLADTSEKVSVQMGESQRSQKSILQLQRISAKKQQQLINSSEIGLKRLNRDLQTSRENVKNAFEEFKSTTDEHRIFIFTIFDHIKKLENLIVGEFSGIYTVIFYFLTVVLSYVLTSTPRTANARIWLLLLVSFNAMLERLIVIYSIDKETSEATLLDLSGSIYQQIWLCRKAISAISCIVLASFSYFYKDYNIINNQLLLDIQRQNKNMQKFIQQISTSPSKTPSMEVVKNGSHVGDLCQDITDVKTCQRRINMDAALKIKKADKKAISRNAEIKMASFNSPLGDLVDDKHIFKNENSLLKGYSNCRYNLRDRARLSSPKKDISPSSKPLLDSKDLKKGANY